jgi:hypothetical protein
MRFLCFKCSKNYKAPNNFFFNVLIYIYITIIYRPGDFFDRKMEKILTHEDFDLYFRRKNDYFKSRINAETFVKNFLEAVGRKIVIFLYIIY